MRTDGQTDGEKDQSSQSSACGVDLSNRGPAKPDSDTETKDVQSEQGRTGRQNKTKKKTFAGFVKFLQEKKNLLQFARFFWRGFSWTNLREDVSLPVLSLPFSCWSVYVHVKHTHTDTQVLCVCILFFYVLYVKHFFVLSCRGYRYKNLKRGSGNTHSQHQPQHCYLSS